LRTDIQTWTPPFEMVPGAGTCFCRIAAFFGGPCFWRTLLLEDLALKDLALEDPALEDLALVDRGIKVDYLNTQLHR
jgi:hypothetical protein